MVVDTVPTPASVATDAGDVSWISASGARASVVHCARPESVDLVQGMKSDLGFLE